MAKDSSFLMILRFYLICFLKGKLLFENRLFSPFCCLLLICPDADPSQKPSSSFFQKHCHMISQQSKTSDKSEVFVVLFFLQNLLGNGVFRIHKNHPSVLCSFCFYKIAIGVNVLTAHKRIFFKAKTNGQQL